MSSLRFISTQSISSTVSTFDITDIFTTDFDIYKMLFTNFTTDTTGQVFSGRFINSSGSVITSSLYDYAVREMKSNAGFGEDRGVNQDNMQSIIGRQGNSSSGGGGVTLYVFNPFNSSQYTNAYSIFSGMSGSDLRVFYGTHCLKENSSITGLQVRNNNNNFTGGSVTIYGIRSDEI